MAYASARISRETAIRAFDHGTGKPPIGEEGFAGYAIGVDFDGVSLQFGIRGDQDAADSIGRLIAALEALREGVVTRLLPPEIAEREPEGDSDAFEPDGPPEGYYAAPDDSRYRAEMRDAGRGAQVR